MRRSIAVGLAAGALAIGGSALAGPEDVSTPAASHGVDAAVRTSCPDAATSFGPPPLVQGDLRRSTDDEFQRTVDLVSEARVVAGTPPPILGDDIADERIRALAEARGYRQRRDAVMHEMVWVSGRLLRPEAAAAWRSMVASARADGVTLSLHSAYRSPLRQRQIFVGKLSARGFGISGVRSGRADAAIDSILRFSSIPGYSRHHTGVAVDIVSPGFGLASFSRSPAFAWLSADNYANAKRHGFVPSYPPSAGPQGPDPESWEYVFVGVDALVSSNRLASIDRLELTDGTVVVEGRPVASEDRLQLHQDERLVAEVTGACSPGAAPGPFRLTASLDRSGDLCVVQRWEQGERLLGCGP